MAANDRSVLPSDIVGHGENSRADKWISTGRKGRFPGCLFNWEGYLDHAWWCSGITLPQGSGDPMWAKVGLEFGAYLMQTNTLPAALCLAQYDFEVCGGACFSVCTGLLGLSPLPGPTFNLIFQVVCGCGLRQVKGPLWVAL